MWGTETSAQQLITGEVGLTRHGESGLPCKQLSPTKLDTVCGQCFICRLVYLDCSFLARLSHWGKVHAVYATVASQKVIHTLSEKIQDVKRKLRLD